MCIFKIKSSSFETEVEQECRKLEDAGVIIGNNGFYTSKTLLNQEQQILDIAKEAIGVSKSIIKDEHFKVATLNRTNSLN
jgi:hypothetical protein